MAPNSLDAATPRVSHSAAEGARRHWGTVQQSGSSPSAAGGASQLISGQELQHLSSLVAAMPQQQASSMHQPGLINRLIALEDAGTLFIACNVQHASMFDQASAPLTTQQVLLTTHQPVGLRRSLDGPFEGWLSVT